MCGIAGIAGEQLYQAALPVMVQRIAHRGPNGRGQWACPDFAFGHVRLSILDVTDAGSQPMVDPETGNVLIFNGEIYNYLELNEELKSGYAFRTRCDTETILAAYRKWGEGCLSRFRGMFAFALWDAKLNRVLLARDRLGIKPLYYRQGPHAFLFASEIKALLKLDGWPAHTVNEPKLLEYFAARQLDCDEQTTFREVRQVLPGHFGWLSPGGRCGALARYWSPPPIGTRAFDAAAADELRERLRQAVSLHLRSDVPVGSFVSGGLDSSTVTCLAAPMMGGRPLHTFSSVLADRNEENALIPYVQQQAGSVAHDLLLDGSSFLDDLPRVAYHHDEPLPDASMYAHYALCRAAREAGVPVMLSGNGGDEVFGGYDSHAYAYLGTLMKRGRLLRLKSAIGAYAANRHESRRGLWARALQEATPFALRRVHKRRQFRPLVAHVTFAAGAADLPFYYNRDRDPFTANYLNNLLHWTVPPFLHYEDRNSMAFGVEVRVPLLDHELAEYVAGFAPAAMVAGRTKQLIRRSMEGVVPAPVLNQRRKFGFAAPLEVFLKKDPKRSLEMYADAVKRTPFLDQKPSMALGKTFYQTGTADDMVRYWRTFSAALWYTLFF